MRSRLSDAWSRIESVDDPFALTTRLAYPNHVGLVWFEAVPDVQGYLMFEIDDAEGNVVAGGGVNQELRTADDLVAASWQWIEWELHGDVYDQLRLLEVERFAPEVRHFLLPHAA